MKNCIVLIILCLAMGSCSQRGCMREDDSFARDGTRVASGIIYEHLARAKTDNEEPLSIHMLSVDPSKTRLELVLAQDKIIGKETTSAMATRAKAEAAINGGFFIVKGEYRGDLDGFFVKDGVILSEPVEKRSSFGFCKLPSGQLPVFDQFTLRSTVSSADGKTITIDGINREPKAGETILFTQNFGDNVRLPQDAEIVVGKGADGKDVTHELTSLRTGKPFSFKDCSFTSAGPTLILDNSVIKDYTGESSKFSEGFVYKRHPRTAVGQKSDGTLLFVVVDGRQPDISIGMTLPELAAFMKEQGAINAYNLDGGGSSTMVVEDTVVNNPSDETGERPSSDAIVILPKG